MERDIHDTILLVLIAAFMLLKAIVLDRESRLGLSMAAFNIILAAAFTWALVAGPEAVHLPHLAWVTSALRVGIILAVGWCIVELVVAKWVFVRTGHRFTGRRRL
jgi:hypothetical protein